MENCIKTQLKSVVDNSNLPLVGELVVKVNSNIIVLPKVPITIRADKNAISTINGGTPVDSISITDTTNPTTIYVSSECTVFIPQYNLNTLQISPLEDINVNYVSAIFGRIDLTILAITNNVDLGVAPASSVGLHLADNTIELSASAYPVLGVLTTQITNKNIKVNIADLCSKAPVLREYKCYTNVEKIVGEFADFGNCKSIEAIYGFGKAGTLESFVVAQRATYHQGQSDERAGRTIGSVNLFWCQNLTFQGVNAGIQGSVKTLSWTENTITFDGTTINA